MGCWCANSHPDTQCDGRGSACNCHEPVFDMPPTQLDRIETLLGELNSKFDLVVTIALEVKPSVEAALKNPMLGGVMRMFGPKS